MSSQARLLLPTEYVHDAAEEIRSATTRVFCIALVVTDVEETSELIEALVDAAARGVDVHVACDAFSYGDLTGNFFPLLYFSKKMKPTKHMQQRLVKAGATFHVLGKTNATLFNGRTHLKWCVVDDTVYSFGGVNLYAGGIRANDYMFKMKDREIASLLAHEFNRVVDADARHYSLPSHSIQYDKNSILIDGGFVGDSIIYRRACALARDAKQVVYVSQYGPTGKLAKLLKKTDTRYYFNSWQRAGSLSRLVLRFGMMMTKLKTEYHHSQYLHAKFMIFEMKDGRTIAITGSHNFAQGGVFLGTREIALETEDSHIIRQLKDFWQAHVA